MAYFDAHLTVVRFINEVTSLFNFFFLQEKETVKKQLEQAREELYKTTDVTTSAEKLLREKDQQISELMEEGAIYWK